MSGPTGDELSVARPLGDAVEFAAVIGAVNEAFGVSANSRHEQKLSRFGSIRTEFRFELAVVIINQNARSVCVGDGDIAVWQIGDAFWSFKRAAAQNRHDPF
jgi:hypothetical protein